MINQKQSEYYERIGDNLRRYAALHAYRAAARRLNPAEDTYLDSLKRLQRKLVETLETLHKGDDDEHKENN